MSGTDSISPRMKAREEIAISSDEVLWEAAERTTSQPRNVAYLRLLWSDRSFLLKGFVFGLIFSLAVAFLIPSQYESSAKLMPPDEQSGLGLGMLAALSGKGESAGAAMEGGIGDLLGAKTTGDLFVGILGSRTVQDDLINKFNLRKVYWDHDWEDTREDLTRKTEISTDRKSGIILLKVTDRNRERAASMNAEYINQLNNILEQADTSRAHRERVFLEGRLRQVKMDLETAEKNFGAFASKNVALDVPAQGKAMVEATASLQGELIADETSLQGLRQIYADNSVRIRSTKARIEELRSQLQKLGGNSAATAEEQNEDGDSIYPSIRRLPLLGVTYADLLRGAKVQETVFESLTQEYEIAKVQEARDLPSVKVLDSPDVPERKSFPPRFLIALLGGFSDLLLCAAWILGRNRWDESDPRTPGRILAQEVISDVRQRFARTGSNGHSPMYRADKVPGRPKTVDENSAEDTMITGRDKSKP